MPSYNPTFLLQNQLVLSKDPEILVTKVVHNPVSIYQQILTEFPYLLTHAQCVKCPRIFCGILEYLRRLACLRQGSVVFIYVLCLSNASVEGEPVPPAQAGKKGGSVRGSSRYGRVQYKVRSS